MLLSVGIIGRNTCWNELFGFPEGAHNRGLPSNPTINITSPLDEDQPLMWLAVVHFTCLFYSKLFYSTHFSSPVTVCFKNGMFLLCLSGELLVEIWSRKFFRLTYVEPKLPCN